LGELEEARWGAIHSQREVLIVYRRNNTPQMNGMARAETRVAHGARLRKSEDRHPRSGPGAPQAQDPDDAYVPLRNPAGAHCKNSHKLCE